MCKLGFSSLLIDINSRPVGEFDIHLTMEENGSSQILLARLLVVVFCC